MPPSGKAPARIFGPGRSASTPSGRPARAAASRTRASRPRCSSSVPWLRLRRTTSTPARTQAVEDGGIVARRTRAWPRSSCVGVTGAYLVAAWTRVLDDPTADLREHLDASPSPCHAVRTSAAALAKAGFTELDERSAWDDVPATGFTVARRRPRRLAARRPTAPAPCRCGSSAPTPTRRACASSRTPITPAPGGSSSASRSTAASCSTAGSIATSASPAGCVLADGSDDPRRRRRGRSPASRSWPSTSTGSVNERGLVLDPQHHLSPVWADGRRRRGPSPAWIADRAGCDVPVAWDLCLYDVQPAAVLGADRSLLASGRLDNLLSCWAATTALAAAEPAGRRGGDRPVRPRGGRFGEHDRGRPDRCSKRVLERLHGARRDRARRLPRGAGRRRAASRPTTPTPSTPTTPSATIPTTPRSSTAGRRSRSTPTSATPRRRRRPALFGRRATRPACRSRRSCPATTCRAARRSARSPPPGSASPRSTSACPQLSMHSARELCGAADPGLPRPRRCRLPLGRLILQHPS